MTVNEGSTSVLEIPSPYSKEGESPNKQCTDKKQQQSDN